MRKKNILYFSYIFILLILIFYCIFHTTLTSNSIFSIKSLENKIKENKEILFSIENETQILQNKISLISDIGNIDIDFLDEEARKKLGLKCKDENIIYHLNN